MPRRTNNNSFRLQTKYVFLTYPHSSSTAENLRDFLWSKLTSLAIFFIAIATELHQDGSPHLHCLIQLDKRCDIRDPSFFDFEGNHPNIQPAKNSKQVLEYISKDGNIITRGDFRNHRVSPTKSDERWRTIIQTATSKEEYLEMIKQEFPHEWATKLHWLEYSASKLFPDIEPPYQSPFPDEFLHCHEEITEWLNRDLYVEPEQLQLRRRSLYICGPSRTGKTSWARSLGRHNYFNGGVDFTTYDVNATYNVIDDIPFKFCPNWKQLVGSQKDFTVNPKYGKKKRVKGGIPCIIIVNNDEDWLESMSDSQREYFYLNCKIHIMSEGETFIASAASSH
ncbi:replication-associated protein [Chickpea yellow dwarf virus]|uniref:Replication-associated protein n=1 Tax=Chickpea yellow dwarf virus TaxID=1568974 RepID=A0A0A0U8Q7_9GEMI|nr:replication-associated protein [Chickpea yellow dwarf virus]AIW42777.1 replication-associated protein [Chickpea yellow dwarf virus]